jgi:hypothetical protein
MILVHTVLSFSNVQYLLVNSSYFLHSSKLTNVLIAAVCQMLVLFVRCCAATKECKDI